MIKSLFNFIQIMFILITFFSSTVRAETSAIVIRSDDNDMKYYLGSLVNTGHDNGFSQTNKIDEGDPHFGWSLGSFFVGGYTRVVDNDKESPIFIKNVGDKVTLWFNLYQDIYNLNSDSSLSINEDGNGYDEYFGIPKTNFGHGVLIIRKTDFQNISEDPIIYTDYLSANAELNANTVVQLCEEGDYEIALNYEIKKSEFIPVFSSFHNYRIFFRFSVRNGNCMVYPFDVTTGSELTNTSYTENGFYLDLANSRYLDIDIKREVLADGANGLIEDIRFNAPARDGAKYTDEGIYTITVRNRYTNSEPTIKTIYVGTDSILRAYARYANTNQEMTIQEIKQQVLSGATIAEDGTIISHLEETVSTSIIPDITTHQESYTGLPLETAAEFDGQENGDISKKNSELIIILFSVGLIIFVLCGIIVINKKGAYKSRKNTNINDKVEHGSDVQDSQKEK